MRLESRAIDDLGAFGIVKGIRLVAGFHSHCQGAGKCKALVQIGDFGFEDHRRERTVAALEPQVVAGAAVLQRVKDRTPGRIGLVEFLRAAVGPFPGEFQVLDEGFTGVGIGAIEEANRIVEALLVRAMNIPPLDLVPVILAGNCLCPKP